MNREVRIVDDRVLLLGLDDLYRSAMKRHEERELLECARAVARDLELRPEPVEPEGYYAESHGLTEYFRLLRALQGEPRSARARLSSLSHFERLKAVTSSPLFGTPDPESESLLPEGWDSLHFALESIEPSQLNVEGVCRRARSIAQDSDDVSLAGLAAWTGDPVLIAGLRETVVLYALTTLLGVSDEPEPVYRWEVSDVLRDRAVAFVATFNELFSDRLPAPEPEAAHDYWRAYEDNEVHGRCARIAVDPTRLDRNYHWGIYEDRDGVYRVEDFWSERLWTTSYYSGHRRFPVHG